MFQMFSKLKTSANPNARFYELPANMEEVKSGYMYKSPPQTLFKSLKSWKRRYFVLSRNPVNHYELKFFRDENRRAKPLGQINLYQVSLFFRETESHPICLWIQRNFRCSASCVLYMKVPEREYFFIAENSGEMEDWFNAIFQVLNTHPTTFSDSQELRKFRSISEPISVLYDDQTSSEDQEQKDPKLSVRQSAPESFNSQYSYYDYPKNYMMTASQSLESEDTEDDEEDKMKIKKESKTEDGSYYMDMESVRKVLMQTQNEDVSFPQTNELYVPEEKEICVSQEEMKNSVIFSEEAGRPRVASWRHSQFSGPFHEGDQILAINDLLTDNLEELQTYLKRLSKDQVKLTILRKPGSQPLGGCSTLK